MTCQLCEDRESLHMIKTQLYSISDGPEGDVVREEVQLDVCHGCGSARMASLEAEGAERII